MAHPFHSGSLKESGCGGGDLWAVPCFHLPNPICAQTPARAERKRFREGKSPRVEKRSLPRRQNTASQNLILVVAWFGIKGGPLTSLALRFLIYSPSVKAPVLHASQDPEMVKWGYEHRSAS